MFKEKYFPAVIIACLAFFIKENAIIILLGMTFLFLIQEYRKPLKCLAWIMIAFVLFFSSIMIFEIRVYNNS